MKRLIAVVVLSLAALVGFAMPAGASDLISASPCAYGYEGAYGNVGPVDYKVCQNIIP